jgi:hypothetical protein
MSERFFALALIAMPIALGFLLNRRFAIRLQQLPWAATLQSKEAVEPKRVKGV